MASNDILPVTALFTKEEIERLFVYRAAVQAGFYSDYPEVLPTYLTLRGLRQMAESKGLV